MNVNYDGSVAQRKININSAVSVEVVEDNNIFNAISLYVPLSMAKDNIVDFDVSLVTVTKPAVLSITVDNYASELRGDLLSMWSPVFNAGVNTAVVLYIIVFDDSVATDALWVIGTKSISFTPLTKAFEELYFISYIKMIFDPYMTGKDISVPDSDATTSTALVTAENATESPISITAGSYTYDDGTKTWTFTFASDVTIPAGGTYGSLLITATEAGAGVGIAVGGTFTEATISSDLTWTVDEINEGEDAVTAYTKVSRYFDHSLALAYLCKNNPKLSVFFTPVVITLPIAEPDTNKCWVRSKTYAEETNTMNSLTVQDRSSYYYGALVLMECENTWFAADSEGINPFVYVMAKWFEGTNDSGEYVGNKMHMIVIDETSVKPFGTPSPLNTAVNKADTEGYDIFDAKHVAYFMPRSASSNTAVALSSALSVTGMPIVALMIAKRVDQMTQQELANMITAQGTLTDPELTDQQAYTRIQTTVITNLKKFSRRLVNIKNTFPDFDVARKDATSLEAASAWSAQYVYDLENINIAGGISA